MNVEAKSAIASRQLTIALVGSFVFELILVGIGIYLYMQLEQAGRHVSAELLFVGVMVLGSVAMLPVFFIVQRLKKLEAMFWQEMAERYGYTYVHRPYFQNNALILQEGKGEATGHGLMGTLHDRPFRFFQYRYVTGSGKNKRTHTYCVFEVVFSGTFPHIYLNNTGNRDLSNLKGVFLPRLTLPPALEKNFNLHGPTGYEIEVLQIFTPDLLQHVLDSNWEHDIELVDQKLYVFREEPIRTSQELEYEVGRLQMLLEILAPTLNRMKLAPVGDLTTSL